MNKRLGKIYTLDACEKLIAHYLDKGGEAETLREGVLGLGKIRLSAPKLKTATITEVYLNEWSSGHKIRMSSVK